jgi:hypothetical protein
MRKWIFSSLLFLSISTFAETYESVLVPDNPSGADVCRNYIAYHKKIDENEIRLAGTSTADLSFVYDGQVVGTMRSNADGSEAATCTPL